MNGRKMDFVPFKLSYWNTGYLTSDKERNDVHINNLDDFENLFKIVKPEPKKENQKTLTRIRQKQRSKGNTQTSGGYVPGLDFDKTTTKPIDVHEILKENGIDHILYTTWGHKVDNEKYKGLNSFKVLLPYPIEGKDNLNEITSALCDLVGKEKKSDDTSPAIFFGGAHPDYIREAEFYSYKDGISSPDIAKKYLLEKSKKLDKAPPSIKKELDIEQLFEIYDKTSGQKFNEKEIDIALDTITGRPIEHYTEYDIWLLTNLAIKSIKNSKNIDTDKLFEKLDEWNQKCYTDIGTYNFEENKNLWEKDDANRPAKDRVGIGTLFYLKKLYEDENKREKIEKSEFIYLKNYLTANIEKPNFLIEDLIPEESTGVISGVGGIGKSTIALGICKGVSSGSFFLGNENYKTTKGSVVIINKEDSSSKIATQIQKDYNLEKQKLILQKCEFAELDDETLLTKEEIKKIESKYENIIIPPWAGNSLLRLSDEKGVIQGNLDTVIKSLKKLKQELKNNNRPPIKLIIFDPLNMWHGGDQNNQKDMSYIYSAFQKIQKELSTAVLVVHHMNKTGGFSGSHVIRDSFRYMFYLRPAKVHPSIDSEKYLELYVDKHNDAKSGYKAFYLKKLNGGLFEFVDTKDIFEEIEAIEEEQMYNAELKKLKVARIKKEIAQRNDNKEEELKVKAKEAIEKKKIKDLELLEDEDAMRADILKSKKRKAMMQEEDDF